MYEKSFPIFYSSCLLCFFFYLRLFYLKTTILSPKELLRPEQEANKKNAEKYQPSNIFEKFILIGVREFFIRLSMRHKRHALDTYHSKKKVFSQSFFFFFDLNAEV